MRWILVLMLMSGQAWADEVRCVPQGQWLCDAVECWPAENPVTSLSVDTNTGELEICRRSECSYNATLIHGDAALQHIRLFNDNGNVSNTTFANYWTTTGRLVLVVQITDVVSTTFADCTRQ